MYRIENNKLYGDGVDHKSTTKKSSGSLKPKFLVIHYTASTNYDSDVRVLSGSNKPNVSCHLVIGPNGEVTQVGDFTDKLWHAGKSEYNGYSYLNGYSIGIEVTCPGWVRKSGFGYVDYAGRRVKNGSPWKIIEAKHKNGTTHEKYWALFTEAQIEKVKEIGSLLMDHYGLEEAVGHDDIAPSRKVDPGPCCPDVIFNFLNGNTEHESADAEIHYDSKETSKSSKEYMVVNVGTGGLNFRDSPNGYKKGVLPEDTVVKMINEEGSWMKVETPAGYTGWVSSGYLKKI